MEIIKEISSKSLFAAFYGYNCDIQEWYFFTRDFFQRNDLLIKSVSYDWEKENGNKFGRESLKKFEEKFVDNFNMNEFGFLSVYRAKKQNDSGSVYFGSDIIKGIASFQIQFNRSIDKTISLSLIDLYIIDFLQKYQVDYGIWFERMNENTYSFGAITGSTNADF